MLGVSTVADWPQNKEIRGFKKEQAGAELGQAQPELGLEDKVFMLWFEL